MRVCVWVCERLCMCACAWVCVCAWARESIVSRIVGMMALVERKKTAQTELAVNSDVKKNE